jgi:DNA repair protein RAD57
LPSLDKACITLADLLTLDAVDVAKRATVPTAEVRKLSDTVLNALHNQLGFSESDAAGKGQNDLGEEHITSDDSVTEIVAHQGGDRGYEPRWISTLDGGLDEVLSGTQHGEYAGGIPTGFVSEITGER